MCNPQLLGSLARAYGVGNVNDGERIVMIYPSGPVVFF